ncbi:MAG TPA: HdeD family acid-resistance protein [Thermopolyspora sp.]|jgi:Uncharacterized conserved protein
MLDQPQLGSVWWVPAIRGVAAVIFGILALVWPGLTILALVVVFGVYAIVDGIFALVGAASGRLGESRTWMAVVGIVGILLGILVFLWPGMTAFVLLMFIAAWFVVTGIFEIASAIRLRKVMRNEWLPMVSGVLSVIFGILLFLWPVRGALALAWLIGIFAIVYGIALLAAAFRQRRLYAGRHGRPTRVV